MSAKYLSIFAVILVLQGCSIQKLQRMKQVAKAAPYEQIDFPSLVRRYIKKDKSNPVEGIYSVSATVTKRSKAFLSSSEKEKVMDRKENYATVAILRDPGVSGREFIEISLPKENQPTYSIIGEFNLTEGGSLLLYRHMEGNGKSTSYTFTKEGDSDIMEGIRVDNEGNTTVTYKLTYVKLSAQ